jgi:hypothetical protein
MNDATDGSDIRIPETGSRTPRQVAKDVRYYAARHCKAWPKESIRELLVTFRG